jgi:adenylate cyclase
MQTAMAGRNRPMPADRRMQYRMGVNLGDVIHEAAHIYGDGVNVAARLQDLAEPGGVCVSGSAYEQVRGKLDWVFESLGEHKLKNIERPVRAFRIVMSRDVARTEGTGSTLPDVPSIAVLLFDNLSGDPEQDYFADGITEDLITDLSKVSGLFVIARNSSFAYRGIASDIRRVSREWAFAMCWKGACAGPLTVE